MLKIILAVIEMQHNMSSLQNEMSLGGNLIISRTAVEAGREQKMLN